MNYKELQHGDVLLYEHRNKQSLVTRIIHLITGSKFVHVSVVVRVADELYVLEQHSERLHSRLDFYYPFVGEVIYCVRPKFQVPSTVNVFDFYREDYGYTSILDSLINHLFGRLSFGKWKTKPILVKLFKSRNIICSTLTARVLQLSTNCSWCKYTSTLEPDDFATHPETFEHLGVVDWVLKDDN